MPSEQPPDSPSARIKAAMLARAADAEPIPSVEPDPQPTFDLGFAPPPSGDEMLESVVPTLIAGDELATDLGGKIDGIIARERSAAEVGIARFVEPIKGEIQSTILESAELMSDLSGKIEDAAFEEMASVGEDSATILAGIAGEPLPFDNPSPGVATIPAQGLVGPMPVNGPPCNCGPFVGVAPPRDTIVMGNGGDLLDYPIFSGPILIDLGGGKFTGAQWLGSRLYDVADFAGRNLTIRSSDPDPTFRGPFDFWAVIDHKPDFDLLVTAAAVTNNGGRQPIAMIQLGITQPPEQAAPPACSCDAVGGSVPPPISIPGIGSDDPGRGPSAPTCEPARPTCMRICEQEQPEDKEPVACFIWLARDDCKLYALPEGDPPRSEDDIRIGNLGTVERINQIASDLCETGDDGDEGESGLSTNPVSECDFLPKGLSIPIPDGDGLGDFLRSLFGDLLDTGLTDFLDGPVQLAVGKLIETGIKFIVRAADVGGQVADDAAEAAGCVSLAHADLRVSASLIGFMERWFGAGFSDAIVPVLQQARFVCPGSVPSAEMATQAFLADQISPETWRCWVRANNFRDGDFEKVSLAARSKLGVSDLISLRARRLITPGQFGARVRELGFLDATEPEEFWKISEQIPGVGDLVRFMVRDSADEDIALKFGYDKFFGDKFIGRVKEWASQNRIPEDYMRFVWRAHWEIPSPTQLSEMRRRLGNLPDGDPAKVTDADIRQALLTQDIAPGWVDKFMRIMTRPLTRVDARRLLERGIIDRQAAVDAWIELGNTRANADRLVSLAEKIAMARAVKHSSVKRYAAGELNAAQMREILKGDGIGSDYWAAALARGKLEAIARRQKTCVASIRKRFLMGEIDRAEMSVAFSQQNLDQDQIIEMVESAVCELRNRGKKASGSLLCQWFEEGLISQAEFFNRLRNLDWDADDATRFIRFCEIKIVRKQTAAEQRKLKAAIKKSQADIRAQKKLANELEADRRRAATEGRQEAARQKTRRKLLLDVAEAMAKRLEIPLAESKRNSNAVFQAVLGEGLATRDETLQLLLDAAKSGDSTDFGALETLTLQLISSSLFL